MDNHLETTGTVNNNIQLRNWSIIAKKEISAYLPSLFALSCFPLFLFALYCKIVPSVKPFVCFTTSQPSISYNFILIIFLHLDSFIMCIIDCHCLLKPSRISLLFIIFFPFGHLQT